MDENDAEKLEEGMKWEFIETPAEDNSVYVRDYIVHLQDLLTKYPDAVLRDVGWYNQEIGIYVQVPKTQSDLIYDKWQDIQPQINELGNKIRVLRSVFTSRPKIIESDVPIPKETLDNIYAEDPDGDYILMGGRILIKEIFDRAGFEVEREKIESEIKLLEDEKEQLLTQYKEALEKENIDE